MRIYHIIPAEQWKNAREDGVYRGDTLDAEGFIHFSTRDQVLWVANGRFKGHPGLLLLEVETDKLIHELKWEPPFEGATGDAAEWKFPHLYGVLNLEAVIIAHAFEPQPDGSFALPSAV